MAPTPSSKAIQPFHTPSKTPNSKHRLHFNSSKHPHPSPNPMFTVKETPQTEHPVEVIGRIRDYADHKEKPVSALNISSDQCSIRVRTETGYRDFSLDGVSVSEEEDLDVFYKKFIQSRINGVKLGAKCTIMMYGPTGAGKSHTMFGCPKQPGIVYMALRDILGEGDEGNDAAAVDSCNLRMGSFVQVTVLEIYNEEIYDLLSNNTGGGIGFGWPKGNASKVRLEVMGKKAKNATYISGNEAGKMSREVMKVEKRRIVKSTLCNDRSSRSHCMIILDVPTVGGRLMLVDMAGSENIEQAGQIGLEAKMQTGKINQGNIALKRVVESIANGDSHVPFRDSKLTMLLQDSFEDDKSKILMVLCASPDPREMHKTISTLEYGAKAKCIVRGGHTPNKDKVAEDSSSAVILGSRIAAMDQFIAKLQMENKRYEKEHKEAHKELLKKEEEVIMLRSQIALMEREGPSASEEEISFKVKERTQNMKLELERKIKECEKMANEFVETGKRMMEDKISQQQQELEMLRRRLEEIESVLCRSKDNNAHGSSLRVSEESGLAKRMMEMYVDDDRGMIKSMDLDMGDSQPIFVHDVKEVEKGVVDRGCFGSQTMVNPCNWTSTEEIDGGMLVPSFNEKVHLSTVFEEEEEEKENSEEEVEKEVVQETSVQARRTNDSNLGFEFDTGSLLAPQNLLFTPKATSYTLYNPDEKGVGLDLMDSSKDPVSARKTRIQNIFMLCGNHREIAQHVGTPRSDKRTIEAADVQGKSVSKELQFPTSELEQHDQALSDLIIRNITKRTPKYGNNTPKAADVQGTIGKSISKELQFDPTSENRSEISSESAHEAKENHRPGDEIENKDDLVEVYVKWEASKEHPGKFITKLKAVNGSSLADLRKLIENYLGEDYSKQGFTFLMLGDPTGAPVLKENEATIQTSKLPICNNQLNVHLACLRPVKVNQQSDKLPFSSLENKLQNASKSPSSFMQHMDSLSPKVDHLNPVPYVSSGFVR